MNFDQKAVKFLASFHVDRDRPRTHGPLRCKAGPEQGPSRDSVWPPGAQALWALAGLWRKMGAPRDLRCCCACSLRELMLERRPPLLADLDTPGPTAYPAPDASLRESSPHPRFSIGRKHPGREGGGRRAWQTAWLQSESPFTQKTDFDREQKWPSPADYQPPSRLACPASRLGGHRLVTRTPEARGRLTPEAPAGRGPGPAAAYDIAPGCRLRSPHPPAFSMGRSPISASWIRSSRTPGPAAYRVEDRFSSRFPTAPGVLIQGERRPKRHDTGPFCAV